MHRVIQERETREKLKKEKEEVSLLDYQFRAGAEMVSSAKQRKRKRSVYARVLSDT